MRILEIRRFVSIAACAVALAGCQAQQGEPKLVLSTKSAVEVRSMQSRAFDTSDRNRTLRTVIATLQDLGYSINKVEPLAGTVSATKLSALQITATIYPRGETQMIVRSNAQVRIPGGRNNAENQVDDPEFYQRLFFEPLSKAMFLTALQVEDKDEAPPPAAGGEKIIPISAPATR
jgi:hypothetical protein